MTQATPLSPLDESHRWAPGDWLRPIEIRVSWACLYRVFDMLEARAAGDNDRLKTLCSRTDLPMPYVSRSAMALLGVILRIFDDNRGWPADLRRQVIDNAANFTAKGVKSELAATHRLEALTIAESLYQEDTDRARELAVGSDTPPHAHLVAAVVLMELMCRGPGQAAAIAGLRASFDKLNTNGYGKDGETP